MPATDNAPAFLEQVAQMIARSSQSTLRSEVEVSYSVPSRCEQMAFDRSDRGWCGDVSGKKVCCVIGLDAQRALLECILDGPGAATPTAVEQTIVAECVNRLLSTPNRTEWHQMQAPAAAVDGVWRCDVDVSSGRWRDARLSLYADAPPVPPPAVKPRIDEVPLTLRARLLPTGATLGDLARWLPGSMLPLGVVAAEISAELIIDGGPITFGVLGNVDGKRAIRLNGDNARRSLT